MFISQIQFRFNDIKNIPAEQYNSELIMKPTKSRLPRISKGDVVEVDVAGGYSYLQDQGLVSGFRLTRFLPGIFVSRQSGEALEKLVNRKSLYRANCLTQLLLMEDFARVVKNLPIPQSEVDPPEMVMSSWSKNEGRWKIRDANGAEMYGHEYAVKYPDVDVKKLPRHNDLTSPQVLRARIEGDWTPNNKVPISTPPDFSPTLVGKKISTPKTMYLFYFADRNSATTFVMNLNEECSRTEISDHEEDGLWSVEVFRDGYLDRDFVERVQALSQLHSGLYDGDFDISE